MGAPFHLLWSIIYAAAFVLLAIVFLTVVYRDRKLLLFLAPLATSEIYLVLAGATRYDLSDSANGNIALAHLVLTTVIAIWLGMRLRTHRASAYFLMCLSILYSLLAAAAGVITDM